MNPSLLYDITAVEYPTVKKQSMIYSNSIISRENTIAIILIIASALILITYKNKQNGEEE